MKTTLIDMVGLTFGRLTVVERVAGGAQARWRCACSCGGSAETNGSNLRRGISRSCGCLQRELIAQRNTRHGHKTGGRYTPEYIAWSNIIARCTKPTSQAWKNYGGRGITICDRWRHDFPAFFADIGPRPSAEHSIDRIDNDRGYEPGNVRWADQSTQAKNKRPRPRGADGAFV